MTDVGCEEVGGDPGPLGGRWSKDFSSQETWSTLVTCTTLSDRRTRYQNFGVCTEV